MSEIFIAVATGMERRFHWYESSLEEAVQCVGETSPSHDLATATISVFHITNGTARKVWQGTPEDARAGRGYITEEPAPEIPPCKYPVGTVLTQLGKDSSGPKTVRSARLVWMYDYTPTSGTPRLENVEERIIDLYYTVVSPDPYPVGSEHVVDLGLLGRQTAKVVSRDGDVVTFVVMMHQDMATVAEFEKAVVK
jgi:hypothetical protein